MNSKKIKSLLRPLAHSTWGKKSRSYVEPLVRDIINYNPIWFNEPLSWSHVISDAFFWRNDGFVSKFDLMNMYSFTVPGEEIVDRVRLVFFSADGHEVERCEYDLKPYEIKSIILSDIVRDMGEWGTFFVFHSCEPENEWTFHTCLTDRGYTAFKQSREDQVWNYVHGCCNTLVLAYDVQQDYYYTLSRKSLRKQIFRPQIRFDDCNNFDVLCSNPLDEPIDIVVKAYGLNKIITCVHPRELDGMASEVIKFDHSLGTIARIEIESHLCLYRPLIFKFYAKSFDALHS